MSGCPVVKYTHVNRRTEGREAMRELTVRIRFREHCIGNAKEANGGYRLLLPRNPFGRIVFPASWHRSNLRFAAQLLGRHQDEAQKILWDVEVDGYVRKGGWFKRQYQTNDGRPRHALHEAFLPGQVVGINCVVPATIPDDDFISLMNIAGRYKGLSPHGPGQFGFFEVESVRPRRAAQPGEGEQHDEGVKQWKHV